MDSPRCADVEFPDGVSLDELCSSSVRVGDHVWDPKMGRGHVLVGESKCGANWYCGYCGDECGGVVPQCECGEVDVLDHHVFVIKKFVETSNQ